VSFECGQKNSYPYSTIFLSSFSFVPALIIPISQVQGSLAKEKSAEDIGHAETNQHLGTHLYNDDTNRAERLDGLSLLWWLQRKKILIKLSLASSLFLLVVSSMINKLRINFSQIS
jgi:hypothetical protein